MRLIAGLGSLVALMLASPAAEAQTWKIGQEREVQPGIYAKLFDQVGTWRIWRFENANGVSCAAALAPSGKAHPYPLDYGYLVGTHPMLILDRSLRDPTVISWSATGRGGRQRAEYRVVGDRFMKELSSLESPPSDLEGKSVEIVVTSWEYPAAFVGLYTDRGVFILDKLSQVSERTLACEGVGSEQTAPPSKP